MLNTYIILQSYWFISSNQYLWWIYSLIKSDYFWSIFQQLKNKPICRVRNRMSVISHISWLCCSSIFSLQCLLRSHTFVLGSLIHVVVWAKNHVLVSIKENIIVKIPLGFWAPASRLARQLFYNTEPLGLPIS